MAPHTVARSRKQSSARALVELARNFVELGWSLWRARASADAGARTIATDFARCCGYGAACDQCDVKRAFKLETRMLGVSAH